MKTSIFGLGLGLTAVFLTFLVVLLPVVTDLAAAAPVSILEYSGLLGGANTSFTCDTLDKVVLPAGNASSEDLVLPNEHEKGLTKRGCWQDQFGWLCDDNLSTLPEIVALFRNQQLGGGAVPEAWPIYFSGQWTVNTDNGLWAALSYAWIEVRKSMPKTDVSMFQPYYSYEFVNIGWFVAQRVKAQQLGLVEVFDTCFFEASVLAANNPRTSTAYIFAPRAYNLRDDDWLYGTILPALMQNPAISNILRVDPTGPTSGSDCRRRMVWTRGNAPSAEIQGVLPFSGHGRCPDQFRGGF